eukprot:CAMPEP_0194292818 /NCGR_PEP_ID=MMETSP0169-20130528/46530_1 /TAXON_ID=218684 /ORGANISM="Corethron pennatum, Strain L29A3" /LENGTH=101 /DNA_ID=CAMNT_0039041137 /DNA_START=67 /DNA_END=369 /DNA_ORIENTATION=+
MTPLGPSHRKDEREHSELSDPSPRKELHLAPMLDISNQEFRAFFRILSSRLILWTEMVVDETVAYSDDVHRHLPRVPPAAGPVVCQVGGNDPVLCANAARA